MPPNSSPFLASLSHSLPHTHSLHGHAARTTFRAHNKLFKLLGNFARTKFSYYSRSAACHELVNSSDGETEANPVEKMPQRDAFMLLNVMAERGVRADASTYNLVLDYCLSLGSIADARRAHANILKLGFDKEGALSGRLVDVYLFLGCVRDAVQAFDDMSFRSIASWNSLMDVFLTRKENDKVLALFSRMMRECRDPNHVSFASALRACSGSKKNWHFVQPIHAKVIRHGFDAHPLVGNPLIDLYAKNGYVDLAMLIFEGLGSRDNVSWVAMISGLTQNGLGEEALELYRQMHRCGTVPTPYVFSSVLSACTKAELFVHGEQLHAQVLKWGFCLETFVGNALVTLYSRCGNLRLAEQIFSGMSYRDGVTYNALISGHAQYGNSESAIQIFKEMQHSCFKLDCVTITSLLSACATLGAIEEGKQLHSYVLKAGLSSDFIIEGSILDLYVKCADVETACEFFNTTNQENVVLWNVMLVAHGEIGNLRESFDMFYQMQLKGLEPNHYTYSSILRTCTYVGALDLGEQIHTLVVKTGFKLNVYVCSVLIDMYCKCGRVDSAKQILEGLTEEDVVSWTTMVAGYVQHEHFVEAIRTFEDMRIHGIRPDNIVLSSAISACTGLKAIEQGLQIHAQAFICGYSKDISIGNSLINLYARCGRITEAYSTFRTIGDKDEITWNGLISGFAQSGHCEEALKVFVKMDQAGVKANLFTYGSAVSAAANTADVKRGKQIHARMVKTGYDSEIEACNAIISLYAKCGCIEDANMVFSGMSQKNEISWNTIIACYSQHGCGREALGLFEKMKDDRLVPNDVTFLAVLAACSHVGLVDEGLDHFNSMNEVHNIVPRPEHYACVVDILGRAGQLNRARAFVETMPVDPNAMIWRTLLSACVVHKNREIGEYAAQHLLELEPHDSANYVLLSNMYAVARKWDKRDQVRQMMKDRGVKKEPGRSWIEVRNAVHAFFVGDRLHPLADAIYVYLDDLNRRTVEIGYKQDRSCLLNEVELEKKDPTAYIHSEKLAVAFGLMNLSPEIPIRVMKNLRICNDCHTWMKFVSIVSGRSIILRDAYRFHHFEGGLCSCGDYW